MRRNSSLILMSMIVLLIVTAVLLFYIFWWSTTSGTVATGTAIPATLPVPSAQQTAPSSEPVDMPMRFVYIISLLVVFVSAVLVLFRMLMRALIKDMK